MLVLTIDPARRLADALGLDGIGNDVVRIDDATLGAAGVRLRGELHCAMLDMKQSWDDLIVRHAPDERTATKILSNPLYQNITGRFVQSHDYIAMERLHELHATGEWDLIVVDTPPTRNALDFLDAPSRMEEFFSSRLLRWLIAPGQGRPPRARRAPVHPDRRPDPRYAVPRGHRRLLPVAPVDVRWVHRPGPRGLAASL